MDGEGLVAGGKPGQHKSFYIKVSWTITTAEAKLCLDQLFSNRNMFYFKMAGLISHDGLQLCSYMHVHVAGGKPGQQKAFTLR